MQILLREFNAETDEEYIFHENYAYSLYVAYIAFQIIIITTGRELKIKITMFPL